METDRQTQFGNKSVRSMSLTNISFPWFGRHRQFEELNFDLYIITLTHTVSVCV